jgi:hypothetical protein
MKAGDGPGGPLACLAEARRSRAKAGSSGWIRTNSPPVNSVMRCLDSRVLRVGSSGEDLPVHGDWQKIVQRLSSAGPNLGWNLNPR